MPACFASILMQAMLNAFSEEIQQNFHQQPALRATCRLQSLLDMEKRTFVSYLTVSVEGHELQVRMPHTGGIQPSQCVHCAAQHPFHVPREQVMSDTQSLRCIMMSEEPRSIAVDTRAESSQVLKSVKWEAVTFYVVEVAIHSTFDRDQIAVFLEGKASLCSAVGNGRLVWFEALAAAMGTRRHDQKTCSAAKLVIHNPHMILLGAAGLRGGHDVAACRVAGVLAPKFQAEAGRRQARHRVLVFLTTGLAMLRCTSYVVCLSHY